MADVLLAAYAAVMRPVQSANDAIQLDLHACAMTGGDSGAEVAQEGLDIAPVDIGAEGLLEDGLEQAVVIVTHRDMTPGNASTPVLRERRVRDSAISAQGIHRDRTITRTWGCISRIFY